MIKGRVILKKGKDFSIQRFHPWIFSGAIAKLEVAVPDGDWVTVVNAAGKILGHGHYQNGSISVRVLSFREAEPSAELYTEKISAAWTLREKAGIISKNTTTFRLIHGEGDGLPGLVIDYYDGVAVVQAHSFGMHNDRNLISEALQKVLGQKLIAVYYKSKATLPGKIKEAQQDGYLFGMAAVPHVVLEHGNKFFVDWEAGQKTGFFLDQCENRKLLGEFASGKKVLNTFCYSGGFSVYALKGGAALVHSVDASEKAVEFTRKNIELNGYHSETHASYAGDTFEFLKDKNDVYDLIILDPPAFAKHRDARHQAVKGYQRLNTEAMKVIKKGGILFTFSCSQVVDRQLFYDTVVSAAIQAGRDVKVLYQLTQSPDHPVSMFHPEGEYLKGLVLYVA
ncbi:MAG TPA: class I SAM-dependent rRNA methyltransferase [Cyclobacteriaceae bacterium]|nr:class I SAM-dependent rRNA methyltransferase [Cyclobacteriaceae bacterium]